MSIQRLRIAKTFSSLQGEGALAGRPMFFIRLAGCSVHECPLHPATTGRCDTDWSAKTVDSLSRIADVAESAGLQWVCVTGGEPADQADAVVRLAGMLRERGMKTMVQTSGVYVWPECWDWLVVSPKCHLRDLKQVVGHELKVVWNGESIDYLRELAWSTRFARHYLQPLFDAGTGQDNAKEVVAMVLQCGQMELPYRLSIQQHRLLGIE